MSTLDFPHVLIQEQYEKHLADSQNLPKQKPATNSPEKKTEQAFLDFIKSKQS